MARLPLVLRFNSKAKVVVVKTPRPSLAGTGNSLQGAWLDSMIAAVSIIRDSGELIPFPYVKIAAGIVVQVLLRVQAVRKNVDDFKGLSQKLVDAIITVRDTVCACGSRGQSLPPEFVHRCSEFVNLLALQSQINDLVRQYESWMRFLRSTAITNAIAQYKEQVNDMRSNFTLDVVVRIYMRLAEGQRPRHLMFTPGLIYLIDAMNDTTTVPMDYCSSPDDFADFLKFRFRKCSGVEVVEKGAFILSLMEVDGSQRPLGQNPETWLSLVKPEVTITMDILISGLTDVDADSGRCSSCRYFYLGASLGDHIQCPQCARSFHVARATIDHAGVEDDGGNDPVATPPPRKTGPPESDDNLPEDIDKSCFRYFRRFGVTLEVINNQVIVDSPLVRDMV